MVKGPTREEWILWLGFASGLKVPEVWAKRDVLTWRAFRMIKTESKSKNGKEKREQREEEEHEESIDEVTYVHKIETQLKVDIIDKVRSDKKAEREAKRKELLAAYKAKK